MTAITLDLRPIIDLTDEQFYRLCQGNPDIKIERDTEGKIVFTRHKLKDQYRSDLRL